MGKKLSNKIHDISVDYQKLFNRWLTIDFDPLDAEKAVRKFERMKESYELATDGSKRSLAQVFIEAFDDCCTVEHCVKVFFYLIPPVAI